MVGVEHPDPGEVWVSAEAGGQCRWSAKEVLLGQRDVLRRGNKKIRRSRSRFRKWLPPRQMMHPEQIDVKRRKSPEKCRSLTEEIPSGTVRTLGIGGQML